MYIKPFEYENINEMYYIYIDIILVSFKGELPEDVEYDVQMRWQDENGKDCITILPCSHPYYRDASLREFAIDYACKLYYEDQRGEL